jgi:hypothetical protein
MATADAGIPPRHGDTPTTLRYTCRECGPNHPLDVPKGRPDTELFMPACQVGADDNRSIASLKYIYDLIRQERAEK